MNTIQSLYTVSIGILLAGMIFFEGFLYTLPSFTASPPQDLHFDSVPNLIAINDIQRNQTTGLLFIRPQDGKEQFIIGTWHAQFSGTSAYAYGKISEKENHLYILSGNEKIYDIKINSLPGSIESVQENPKGTYLFLQVKNGSNTIYCVAPKPSGEEIACQQLEIGGIARAKWNPHKDHELIIQTTKGELFTFDPWEKIPHLLDSTDKNSPFEELQATDNQNIYQFLNAVIIRAGSNWHVYRIPITATVTWFNDNNHLLIRGRDTLSLIELSTYKIATLLKQERLSKYTITTQTPDPR